MKHILFMLIFILLVGCSRNEITIANSGTNTWEKIEITAGGHQFNIDKLQAGKFKRFSFRSKNEGGGVITAELNEGKLEHQFGYFTPNLTSKDAIFLNNNTQNEIEIINMASTVQTIEEIITKKRMGTNNPAFKNLRVPGKKSQAEVK